MLSHWRVMAVAGIRAFRPRILCAWGKAGFEDEDEEASPLGCRERVSRVSGSDAWSSGYSTTPAYASGPFAETRGGRGARPPRPPGTNYGGCGGEIRGTNTRRTRSHLCRKADRQTVSLVVVVVLLLPEAGQSPCTPGGKWPARWKFHNEAGSPSPFFLLCSSCKDSQPRMHEPRGPRWREDFFRK